MGGQAGQKFECKELYIDGHYMMLCDYMQSETVENKYEPVFLGRFPLRGLLNK